MATHFCMLVYKIVQNFVLAQEIYQFHPNYVGLWRQLKYVSYFSDLALHLKKLVPALARPNEYWGQSDKNRELLFLYLLLFLLHLCPLNQKRKSPFLVHTDRRHKYPPFPV